MAEEDALLQAAGGGAEGPGGVAEGFGEEAVSHGSGAGHQGSGIVFSFSFLLFFSLTFLASSSRKLVVFVGGFAFSILYDRRHNL